MNRNLWIVLAVIGATVALLAFYVLGQPKAAASLESVRTTPAPWPVDSEHVKERLDAIGLPALAQEGTVLHTHQHLDIYLHGTSTPVATGIGLHEAYPPFIAPIHTHDNTGIVHVESPTPGTFTLGQFFDIWGVRFSGSCIGAYCADEKNALLVYVNGERYQGDPRNIELTPHEEIAVIYGLASETPSAIPATYSFPEGY
jgi:hypothetical protein